MAARASATDAPESPAPAPAGRDAPLTTVLVVGNLGSKKSTVLQLLSHMTFPRPAFVYPEPVEDWEGEGFLNGIYHSEGEDKVKAVTNFQMEVIGWYNYVQRAIERRGAEIAIVERGPGDVRDVFLPVNRPLLGDATYAAFQKITHANFFSRGGGVLDARREDVYTVYLRTTPEMCASRIAARSRDSEVGAVSMDYLRQIHNLYEDAYADRAAFGDRLMVLEADDVTSQDLVDKIVRGLLIR